MSRRYIQHLRSKDVETIQQYGLNKDIPKVPETDNLKDGEIAINYAKDNEIISIKNDNDEIVKFLNEKVIYENEEITAAAMSQLKNEIANEINNINDIIENFEPGDAGVQSDWDETDEESLAYIKNKPTIPTKTSDLNNDSGFITMSDVTEQVQSDWDETDEESSAYIKNKPTIPTVNDAPLIIQKNGTDVATFKANAEERVFANIEVPTRTSDLTNDSGFITAGEIEGGVQSDWDETDEDSLAYIQNKPAIPTKVSDLTNDSGFITMSDVTEQVQSDWNETSSTSLAFIKNKPTIPTKTSDLTNDSGFITAGEIEGGVQSDWNETSSASLAFIKNKPTIPTKTSDLNNDSGFITMSDVTEQVQSNWDETDEDSLAYIQNKPIFILHMTQEPSEQEKTVSIRETYEDLAMAVKNGKTILLWGVTMQGDYMYTIDSNHSGIRVGSDSIDPRNGNYIFYFTRFTDSGNSVIYGFGQGRNNTLSLKVFNNLDEVLCVTITSRQSRQSNEELTNISCDQPCSLIYQSYENGVNIIAKNIINDASGFNGVDSARVYNLVKATPHTETNDGTLQFVSYEVGDTFITIYTYNATFGANSDNWTYSSEKLYYMSYIYNADWIENGSYDSDNPTYRKIEKYNELLEAINNGQMIMLQNYLATVIDTTSEIDTIILKFGSSNYKASGGVTTVSIVKYEDLNYCEVTIGEVNPVYDASWLRNANERTVENFDALIQATDNSVAIHIKTSNSVTLYAIQTSISNGIISLTFLDTSTHSIITYTTHVENGSVAVDRDERRLALTS